MAISDISRFKKPIEEDPSDYIPFIQDNIRFILSFIIVTNFLLIFLLKFSIKLKNKFEAFFNFKVGQKETLIIIAHPDDEVMFFLPTIRFLLKNNVKVRIMCLSNGNFNGLGVVREEEFENVCKLLKIEDRVLVNDSNLQDDIRIKWSSEHVSQIIKEYLEKDNNLDKIGSIITFDEKGVTRHPNHISCHEGFIQYLKSNKQTIIDKEISPYILDSHNALSQYSFIIPFIFFYFKEFGFFNKNFMYNYRVMKNYRSQFNFMRKLHIIFSSYTYYNTLTKIEFQS